MSVHLALGIAVLLILTGLTIGSVATGVRIPWPLRVPVVLLVPAPAAFCSFCFLATFEPGSSPLRLPYGMAAVISLVGAGWLLTGKRGGR
jgi:hypothetical protein